MNYLSNFNSTNITIPINQIYFSRKSKEEIENKCKLWANKYDFSGHTNRGFIKGWIEKEENRNTLYIASPEIIEFPKDCSSLFCNFPSVDKIKFDNINTSNVTNMDGMFLECKQLKELDLSKFDFSKVNNLDATFAWLESLTELDLSNLLGTTRNIFLFHTFRGDKNLRKLNISNLIIDMQHYYEECKKSQNTTDYCNRYNNLFEGIPDDIQIYVKNKDEKEKLKIISEGLFTDNNIIFST